jgi:polyisoprenoid-binding protein YceI
VATATLAEEEKIMTTGTSGGQQPGGGVAALARDGALAGPWRLDPQQSTVEFRVPHFWHMITVRGWFDRLEGEGSVAPDGTVTGRIVIDATSLNTKNKQRDKHLRSADFFHAERHPQAVLTVSRATLTAAGQLSGEGTLEAAGTQEPIRFTADILEASPDAVTLRAEVTVDRSRFGMTWSPMRVASMRATGSVTARFTHSSADGAAPADPGTTS